MKRKIVSDLKERFFNAEKVATERIGLGPLVAAGNLPILRRGEGHYPSEIVELARELKRQNTLGDSPFIIVEEAPYPWPTITDDELLGRKPYIPDTVDDERQVEFKNDVNHFVRGALSILMSAEEEGPQHYADIIRDARELLEELNNKYKDKGL